MKRIALLFSIAAAVLCASCKKDEPAKPQLESIVISPSNVAATTDMRLEDFIDIFTIKTIPASYDKYNVVFTSSNPMVVDIRSNGRFKIQSVGTAVVTATLDGKTATCEFQVIESARDWPFEEAPKDPIMIYFNDPFIEGLGVDQAIKPEFTVFPSTADMSTIRFTGDVVGEGVGVIEYVGDGYIMGREPGSTELAVMIKIKPEDKLSESLIARIPVTVKKL